MNDYKLLTKQEDYDLPTVKELASAMNELAQMEQRRAHLEDLIRINGKLKKHIWRDKSGFAIALADLKDDHLKNIVNYVKRRGDVVPPNVMREINQRNINLNSNPQYMLIEPPEPAV